MELSDAIRELGRIAREDGPIELCGERWRRFAPLVLRRPMMSEAAAAVNAALNVTGTRPPATLPDLLLSLVERHIEAVARYGDLLDGVRALRGEDGVVGALEAERVERVIEREVSHLRSGANATIVAVS